jgi:hypothetical protein
VSEDQLYKIDSKRIPIPPARRKNAGKSNFLKSLSLGESFVVFENDKKNNVGNWRLIAKRMNMKICSRKIDTVTNLIEGKLVSQNKHRIWIIEKDGVKLDEQG